MRQLAVDLLSEVDLADCSFIPRLCGVGTRLVIVTIQLLFVEATIEYACSVVVVNKLGEDSNRSRHTECKCSQSCATRQSVIEFEQDFNMLETRQYTASTSK